jgi:hypothetical protein
VARKSLVALLLLLGGTLALARRSPPAALAQTEEVCTADFNAISLPLTDLGPGEYVRYQGGRTGYHGGLYPGGSNERPPAHEAGGVALAQQITPLSAAGAPDPDGYVVMISAGMSNAAMEFIAFIDRFESDPDVHPRLRLVSGAQAGQIATDWTDPAAPAWDVVDQRLNHHGLHPNQVQVAWIKNVRTGGGDFPEKAELLQGDLAAIARALKIRYPNVRLAYLSSRTRGYTYWTGLSPEPAAFESGFAVKWLVEQQIGGDPTLNYDPAAGPVVAPFLSWGPYLWIDGLNPRGDGLVWTQADLVADCTHPSGSGVAKVADQLLDFFKTDATAQPWFLAEPPQPPAPMPTYLPLLTATGDRSLIPDPRSPIPIPDILADVSGARPRRFPGWPAGRTAAPSQALP